MFTHTLLMAALLAVHADTTTHKDSAVFPKPLPEAQWGRWEHYFYRHDPRIKQSLWMYDDSERFTRKALQQMHYKSVHAPLLSPPFDWKWYNKLYFTNGGLGEG